MFDSGSLCAGALSSRIFGGAFQDAVVAALLSDEQYCRALLQFEGALAFVQGQEGLIPKPVAQQIQRVCGELNLDLNVLAAGVQRDGMPMIAVISQLREAVGVQAADFVHFGATSQDAMDTALLLQLKPIVQHLKSNLQAVASQLVCLAEEHRTVVMVARTHGQHAVPTSFGLKVAGWLSPLLNHLQRLQQLEARLWQLQLAGAAGTLASLGSAAPAVREGLALQLGLGLGEMSWHTQRDGLVELGSWLSLVCGSLGKFAQDTILMTQSEISEVQEAAAGVRGASSCMPQKNNPMRCEQVLAAARAVAGHLAPLHGALVQEHERGTHGWQVEWLSLPPMVSLTSGALANSRAILNDLQVAPDIMLRNLRANFDLALSERLSVALAAQLPRSEAQGHLRNSALRALKEERSVLEILSEELQQAAPTMAAALNWQQLADPSLALGQSTQFLDAVLQRAKSLLPEG